MSDSFRQTEEIIRNLLPDFQIFLNVYHNPLAVFHEDIFGGWSGYVVEVYNIAPVTTHEIRLGAEYCLKLLKSKMGFYALVGSPDNSVSAVAFDIHNVAVGDFP